MKSLRAEDAPPALDWGTTEVAVALDITPKTLADWIRRGTLPFPVTAVWHGRGRYRYRFASAHVNAWLTEHKARKGIVTW